ncbi:hypothetical protein SteCoe_31878 [Stentor coeruleus]|uniref:EF-hand domain-containing protein n=1 Tax=Stentor coeruleus TaxID=5963 RepID=A0A1R2B0A8_9CILI|nr:hypothetical protein SteCoe_31878 [Stentor coeruleus]
MGNTTKHTQIQNSSLLASVEESLIFLTQWKKPGLLLIYNRYKADFPSKTHLNYLELSKVCGKSLPEMHLILLYEIFANNIYKTVNFLELISVLITYSELSWDSKVKMIFQVFDFDKSKSLTRDEILIMSKCFFKGIQVATNNRFQLPFVLETSSLQECYFPEIHNAEGIFLPDVIKWVKNQKYLYHLLSTYSCEQSRDLSGGPLESKTFDRRLHINKKNKRFSSAGIRPPPPPVKEPEKKDYIALFKSACNRLKKAQVSTLYMHMCRTSLFFKESEIFFGLFHLKLKTELTLPEFLRISKQIKDTKVLRNEERKNTIIAQRKRLSALHMDNRYTVPPAILKRLFEKYDTNGDGVIDMLELRNGLKDFLSKKACEELFNMYDSDKNHCLDLEEFLRLFSPDRPAASFYSAEQVSF